MGKNNLRASLPSRVAYMGLLVASVSWLGFAVGCGGSSGPSVPITGNFSNSSLSGSYVYNLYGIDTTGNQYAEAGVFTADGNGNITSGVDDFNQLGNGFAPSNPITGRYTIGQDGNGTILFTLTNATTSNNTFQVSITLVSTSQLYMTEADTFANASGEANLQTSSGFAAPSGTLAFRIHNANATNSSSLVGAMTIAGGALSGPLDEMRAGTAYLNASIVAGNVNAPDSTGRGTLSFQDTVGITSTYVYYEINSTTYELLQQDVNQLGQGRMEQQSGSLAFSGNYVFGSNGDTNSPLSLLNVRSAGGLTSDGTSTITGGAYDSVVNGSQIVNQPFGGSFTASPNGRVQLTLTPSGASPISEIVWMVNSGRAFFLVNDTTKEEDGTMDQQQNISFSNSSLKGQYAFVNDGFFFNAQLPFLTRVGTFIPDGNGNVKLNEVPNSFLPDPNVGGTVGPAVVVPGTYSVAAPGRATVTLAGSQGNIDLVLYMQSPGAAYVVQNDSGTEIGGKMAIQVSP
jgi:hypothetical protein